MNLINELKSTNGKTYKLAEVELTYREGIKFNKRIYVDSETMEGVNLIPHYKDLRFIGLETEPFKKEFRFIRFIEGAFLYRRVANELLISFSDARKKIKGKFIRVNGEIIDDTYYIVDIVDKVEIDYLLSAYYREKRFKNPELIIDSL